MPSRPVVVLLLAFWLATTGFVLYRDVWPLVSASGPPPIVVELSDEASAHAPIHWTLYHGDVKAGHLRTAIFYNDADDTLWVNYRYTHVHLDVAGARIVIPELTSAVRITRTGSLLEQVVHGRIGVQIGHRQPGAEPTFETQVEARGQVENGQFTGTCTIDALDGEYPLGPVPVPEGHALSPLQPVHRLGHVRAGQQWVVHEVDPLGEAMLAVIRGKLGGFGPLEPKREPLIATVSAAPESLSWQGESVPCWVIEYRGSEPKARTWVRVDDGKVLRQEAFGSGDRVAIDRDE